MPLASIKKWLVASNGWQRIWFVSSVVCLLYFVLVFPIVETNKGSSFRYETKWAIEEEMKNPFCAPYMSDAFENLIEPEFDPDKKNCYKIYLHRKYAEGNQPITLAIYDSQFESEEKSRWLMHIGIGLLLSSLLSAITYGCGVVVSWVIRGFKESDAIRKQ